MRPYITGFIAALIPLFAQGQQMLTVDDAVAVSLKHNYDILVVKTDSDIARLNNTTGNAGMLPTIAVNASENYSNNSISQKLSNGTDINSPNVAFNNMNANIALTWTIFDGAKMFITKEKLGKQEELGGILLKQQVAETVSQVIGAYYDVVRQKKQLKAIEEIIAYNTERVKISEVRFNIGSSAKTELLQAQIDLNLQKSNAILQTETILRSKRTLNLALGRDANTDFEVSDSIPLTYDVSTATASNLQSSNLSLLSAQKQVEIAGLSMREFSSQRYPRLVFNTGYYFARSDNKAGFTLLNQTSGPQAGLALSMPLFQGSNINRQVNTAKLGIQSQMYIYEAAKIRVNTELLNAQTSYSNQDQLLKIEESNVLLAKENLDLSLMRLKLGQTNSLEVSQAQINYENALTRLNTIRYNLKIAETTIKKLLNTL